EKHGFFWSCMHVVQVNGCAMSGLLDIFGANSACVFQIELVQDPGPATFVSSCAVFTLCLVQLMQHTSHHRYQNTFILCGAICALLIGVSTVQHGTILFDMLTAYLPATTIVAQILSLTLHGLFRSWRDPNLCDHGTPHR